MKQKSVWYIVLAAYVAFIFFNSLTPAEISSKESGLIVNIFSNILDEFEINFLTVTEIFIRKAAHFTEYTILGIILYKTFSGSAKYTLAYFVPLVDETLQLFTEGRSGQISDVWLDISGAAFGILIMYAVFWFRKKREK